MLASFSFLGHDLWGDLLERYIVIIEVETKLLDCLRHNRADEPNALLISLIRDPLKSVSRLVIGGGGFLLSC